MIRWQLVCGFVMAFVIVQSQSINTPFGKNRIQYHDDFKNWWQYESTNFVTYWYGKSSKIARNTILMAEMDYQTIQEALEHRINDKIEIIVYTDITDLKQSNIGTEEIFTNQTGETKIAGNKMFVYFDGNHLNLRQKIREGIATVYFNNMLFGSSIQEIVQNALLLNLPEWYKLGILVYASTSWDASAENELRDIWNADERYHNFEKLANDYPKIAGRSFWFFIEQVYGKSTITNLLYLTKISRNMENSFQYILNAEPLAIQKEWNVFYTNYYKSERFKMAEDNDKNRVVLHDRKIKKGAVISKISLDPQGKLLAYTVNELGNYRIILHDLVTGKEEVVFKYGFKNLFQETDYNYPLIAWHPEKQEITFVYEHRDIIYLVKYNLRSRETIEQKIPEEFQRIYSISYIDDNDYVFSASTDGWSDLYRYNYKKRNQTRLTEDYFDDLDAIYSTLNGKKGILFSSNRQIDSIYPMKIDTILPLNSFDIYFLPDHAKKAIKLTDTPFSNERQPEMYDNGKILCLGDQSGIVNTYSIDENNLFPIPLTNFDRNIVIHSTQKTSDNYFRLCVKDGIFRVYNDKIDTKIRVNPFVTAINQSINLSIPVKKEDNLIPEAKMSQEVINDFLFQSQYNDPPVLESLNIRIPENERLNNHDFNLQYIQRRRPPSPLEKYDNVRAIAANKKFALTDVTTKLDNELLFEGLESYTGDMQQLLKTPMGFLLKANMKDIFEDHEIEVGLRIPTSFNGSEYFLVYDNKKGRIDKKYALYRKSIKYNNDIPITGNLVSKSKKTSLLGLYQLKYPLDIYRSVRATGSLRLDDYIQLSTEHTSFSAPAVHEKRLSIKLEYVYDNTFDVSLNIKNGTRYKFYSEVINSFDFKLTDGFDINLSKGFTTIIGFDARHYLPILSKSVLAIRMAGATSLGSQKMLYYLGGMENWLFPSFNDNVRVPDHSDYAYKTNVFQMRGFNNNTRNGSTFLVVNAELRIPFMQYILGKNRGNAFFRNLQLTGFADAGLAWHGSSPFSKKNLLNILNLTSPPLIEMEIEYFKDPLAFGFGTGLRTQILGYFIKADYGWGVESRIIQKPIFYLTLGMDF